MKINKYRAVLKGAWVLEGGIEIPVISYIYRAKIHTRIHVNIIIQDADAKRV